MLVDLDTAHVAVLRELLETRLGNLSSEIRHTDSPRVRVELREEREALRSLLDALREKAV
jgi:hypothetical protein